MGDTDDEDDDLRTRRGQFLRVEETNSRYRETSVKGDVVEYVVDERPLELRFEGLALHTTSDVASGVVRNLLTARTHRQDFRAIGTEGNYGISDVSIGADTPEGTVVIRKVYGEDGHALRSQMSIGLPDETVKVFGERLPGTLRLSGIEGTFYTSGPYDQTVLLDYWRHHVVSDRGSDEVIAEWRCSFSTATLSPEGYSRFGGYWPSPSNNNERHVSGSITVHSSGDQELRQTVERLADNVREAANGILFGLIAIAAVLLFVAFKGHI